VDRAKFIFSRGKEPPDRIQHDVVAIGQLVRVVDRPLAVPIRSSYGVSAYMTASKNPANTPMTPAIMPKKARETPNEWNPWGPS